MLEQVTADEASLTDRPAALFFLTTIEVADRLRISRRTLERMRVDGTGPRYIKVGPGKKSRVLYREADVIAWIDKFQFGSTSEYGR
jgi:predicted DNA-binding transcriptional regulator AlpA